MALFYHAQSDYIILDYPFGKAYQAIKPYIDLAVWIDIPLDISLARRLIRDFLKRSPERRPIGNPADETLSYLEFYINRHRATFLIHNETARISVDLVVDGMKSPEVIADEILTHINTRNHYDTLIDENNDPVHDPAPLKAHMDKWDGEAFIEVLQLSPDMSVLEIGVGTGRLAMRVCDKCRSFTGIDISPKTIERARENLRGFANIDLICGDFFTYPFSDKFNIIYSSLTFMHIQDKRAAIQRAVSLLKPSGRFVLSIDKNQQTEIDYGNRRIIVYPDTPEEITALIAEAGLTIEKQFETEFAVIFAATKEV